MITRAVVEQRKKNKKKQGMRRGAIGYRTGRNMKVDGNTGWSDAVLWYVGRYIERRRERERVQYSRGQQGGRWLESTYCFFLLF